MRRGIVGGRVKVPICISQGFQSIPRVWWICWVRPRAEVFREVLHLPAFGGRSVLDGWIPVGSLRPKMQRWKALRDAVMGRSAPNLVIQLRRGFGCSAIGPHESKRARYYEGKGECDSPSNGDLHGVHVFQCRDQLGIIARISKCIASRGANILNVDLYIDFDGGKQSPVFYARSEFAFDPLQWPRAVMDEDFAELSDHFKAERSIVRVLGSDPDLKLAVLASWQDHCLIDLLHRWQEGELPVNISCVISNHNRGLNTHVCRFLERHGIPYHYLPTTRADKREEEILDLASGTDFLVLARYMQVLSPVFLRGYKKDIINIHHGLLPSFKGANPYRQAYEAGVKLIGATSHFVTEELDDGPIIEQMVDRVSHRDSLHAFATRSENLEKQCLANAIKYYCEQRILRYSTNKTIVFG